MSTSAFSVIHYPSVIKDKIRTTFKVPHTGKPGTNECSLLTADKQIKA